MDFQHRHEVNKIGQQLWSDLVISMAMARENYRMKAMVIEDSRVDRAFALKLLQNLNFNVSAASDGREALHMLDAAEELPSIVLCDGTCLFSVIKHNHIDPSSTPGRVL